MSLVHLGAEDAKDWAYKGEGAANLVLSYCGSSPFMVGKVLRVRKILKGRRSQRGELLTRHEQLLWSDTGELVDSASKEISEEVFVTCVMAPLLGSEFIDAGNRISVAREFLESIEKNINDQRPAWRVDASEVDTLSDSALLIPDHSVFLSGNAGS